MELPVFEELSEGPRVKCNFCNNAQVPPDQAFSGPDVFICHQCVRDLSEQVGAERLAEDRQSGDDSRECSFCGQPQDFADGIIVAGEKYLCTECLRRFRDDLDRQPAST